MPHWLTVRGAASGLLAAAGREAVLLARELLTVGDKNVVPVVGGWA